MLAFGRSSEASPRTEGYTEGTKEHKACLVKHPQSAGEGESEMAMKRGNGNSGHRPGGGIASRQRVEKPVKVGAAARVMRPQGVSQIGSSIGNRVTNSGRTLSGAVEPVRGKALPAGLSVPLGNQVALNVGRGGPGAGRVGDQPTTRARRGLTQTSGPRNSARLRPGYP